MKQVDLQGNVYDCQIEQNHSVIATKFYSLEKQIELKDKEIERLKEQLNDEIDDGLKQSEIMLKQHNEIERLHFIIKEVREYIRNNSQWYDKELGLVAIEGYKSNRIPIVSIYGLLEILDNVEEK